MSQSSPALPLSRERLPWAFWIWQLVPLILVVIKYPPISFSEPNPALHGIDQLSNLPTPLPLSREVIDSIMVCQGTFLAYWIIWGSGGRLARTAKALGLGLVASVLSAIWMARFSGPTAEGTMPTWGHALDPVTLVSMAIANAIRFLLPPLFVAFFLYRSGYRLIRTPTSSDNPQPASLAKVAIIPAIAFFVYFAICQVYPRLDSLLADYSLAAFDLFFYLFLVIWASTLLTAILVAGFLIRQDWRPPALALGCLLLYQAITGVSVNAIGMTIEKGTGMFYFEMATKLILANLLMFSVNQFWLGRHGFVLTRLPTAETP